MEKFRRWYDRDPILSKTMKILETSNDEFQIKMAINLIKVIIEHNIESDEFKTVDDIMSAVDFGSTAKGNSRWYDIDKTVKTAIQMLENCPETTQELISRQIASMVIDKFNQSEEDDEDEAE